MADSSLLGINGDLVNKILPFGKEDVSFSFRYPNNLIGAINICPTSMRNQMFGNFDADVSLSDANGPFQGILDRIPAV